MLNEEMMNVSAHESTIKFMNMKNSKKKKKVGQRNIQAAFLGLISKKIKETVIFPSKWMYVSAFAATMWVRTCKFVWI